MRVISAGATICSTRSRFADERIPGGGREILDMADRDELELAPTTRG